MSRKLREDVSVIPVTAAAAITVDQVLLIGTLVGIAVAAAVTGETIGVALEGLIEDAPSDTGTAWNQGDALYWDDTNKRFTKTASGNTLCAKAYAAKASGSTTARVLLANGI